MLNTTDPNVGLLFIKCDKRKKEREKHIIICHKMVWGKQIFVNNKNRVTRVPPQPIPIPAMRFVKR